MYVVLGRPAMRARVLGWMAVLLGLAPIVGAPRAEAAVTAFVSGNQLLVTGDDTDNVITLQVAPLALSEVEVRSGNALVGSVARASFTTIVVTALGGNDNILISRAFGVITQPANISGGVGNDAIRTGPADDDVTGGPGDDTFTWLAGDGDDVFDGGDGPDLLRYEATGNADFIGVDIQSPVTGFVRVDRALAVNTPLLERVVVMTTSNLTVSMLGGNDQFDSSHVTSAQIRITVDGNDNVFGGDVLIGGNGTDVLAGFEENDTVLGGPGDDVIGWADGHANDTIEGGDGHDYLLFYGGTGNDRFTITPNGSRRAFRDVENVTLDVDDVEEIEIHAEPGDDTVTGANGLAATGLTVLRVFGDKGNDVMTGGDTKNQLFGDQGDDTLIGGPGDDELNGGGGVNLLKGGPGNDLFTLLSFEGDGVSSAHGEEGLDRVLVQEFSNSDAVIAASAFAGAQFRVDRITRGGSAIAVDGIEQLDIATLARADTITIGPGLTGFAISVDGGADADVIRTHASSVATFTGGDDADQLVFDALNQPVSVSPSTIASGGATRATHAQIETERFENLPGALPAIAITSPTAEASTTAAAPFLRLAGTASDADGIASVTFTNDRGGSGTAAGTTAWTAAHVPLVAGTNVLTATVRDTAGNEVSDTLTVQVKQLLDRKGLYLATSIRQLLIAFSKGLSKNN